VVIAYLMKLRGWRLAESYKWVKDKRPSTNISEGARMLLPGPRLCLASLPCSSASSCAVCFLLACRCSLRAKLATP
jgi:hypothetical protein